MNTRLTGISHHPREVLGFRKNGRAIYPIAGGSVDAGIGDRPDPDDHGTGSAATDAGADAEGDGSDGTSAISKDEHDKVVSRMNAADKAKGEAERRLNEALNRLKEFEDKDKSEIEKAQADAAEAAKRAEAAETALQRERVNNAFLLHNKVTWHNPERALALLDLSDVTIAEDGTVIGMDKAIEALSKSDPYLIKTEDTPAGDLPPSGTPAGSGGRKPNASADREKMLAKYPALRR